MKLPDFSTLNAEQAAFIVNLNAGERDVPFGPALDRDEVLVSLRHVSAYELAARSVRDRDVLDVGCGSGVGTAFLSRTARRTVAIDVTAPLVEVMPRVHPTAKVEWRHYDGERFPFPDASFDRVTSFQVIEHVPDPVAFLTEIRRVLRPGGMAFVTTPNRTFRVAPGTRSWNPYHVREFWPWELRPLFRRAGFTSIEVQGLYARLDLMLSEHRRTAKLMIGSAMSNRWRDRIRTWRRRGHPANGAAAPATNGHAHAAANDALGSLDSDMFHWRPFTAGSLDVLVSAHV